ncbi:MAG TPA: sugar ABC transporter substrate-binding protein [Chloroflexota bacterium]|nr:sugar ABC transporter substrate-binding protein [Chloroflexota bacterium]
MNREPTLNRRRVLGIGGGAALSLLVAACSSGGSSAPPVATSAPAPTAASGAATTAPTATSATSAAAAPAATAATSGAPVSLTLSYRSGNAPYFEERSKTFSGSTPNITIEQRPIAGSNDAYYPKLTAEFAAGSASDVFWVSTGFGLYDSYAYSKQLIAADPFIQGDNIDLGQWIPAAISTLKLDGKLYALPWGMHPDDIGLWYNKDMFDKAGVEPPDLNKETHDSLIEKAAKLTKRTGSHTDVWGLATTTAPFEGLISIVRSYGGDYMTDDKKKGAMDSPEALAALQWMADIRTKEKVNPLFSQTPANGLESAFIGQTLAMFNEGVWGLAMAAKIGTKFTMGVSLMPKGPKGIRGSMSHVDTISGYSKGKHQPEAFKFIEFLTNKESGVQNALVNAFWGARPDVWADPAPKQKYGSLLDAWVAGMQDVMPLDEPWNFRLVELNTGMDNTLQPVWNGDTAPKDAVPKLQDAINTVLAKSPQ